MWFDESNSCINQAPTEIDFERNKKGGRLPFLQEMSTRKKWGLAPFLVPFILSCFLFHKIHFFSPKKKAIFL
jgi:hypothetical protein